MKATALLEKQHRKVESLFSALETGHRAQKQLDDLATALTGHAMIEEELFYPEVKKLQPDLVLESYEEHELMAYALQRLMACQPDHESFPARLKALKEIVEEHVQEEETELFPTVTRGLPEDREEAIGKQMDERFKELNHLGYEGALAAKKTAKRTTGSARTQTASSGAGAAAKPNNIPKKKTGHSTTRHP